LEETQSVELCGFQGTKVCKIFDNSKCFLQEVRGKKFFSKKFFQKILFLGFLFWEFSSENFRNFFLIFWKVLLMGQG
jgi:hypothetical protein